MEDVAGHLIAVAKRRDYEITGLGWPPGKEGAKGWPPVLVSRCPSAMLSISQHAGACRGARRVSIAEGRRYSVDALRDELHRFEWEWARLDAMAWPRFGDPRRGAVNGGST
jgi:hypothetical protein